MTTIAIELHDAGITAAGVEATGPELPSPGFAIVKNGSLITGEQATREERLDPRSVIHHFWDALDTEPLEPPLPASWSAADVAFAHLTAIRKALGEEPERVVLASPGIFSSSQLALALGVARTAGLPVRGLVDSAVAASASAAQPGRILHLDLRLHRAVLTELELDDRLRRLRVASTEELGLLRLRDLWAKWIARAFVRETRFDPLHEARTEQVLYDRLPGWLEAAEAHGGVAMEMEADERSYTVEMSRVECAGVATEAYGSLAPLVGETATEAGTLLLGGQGGPLPGLATWLQAKTGLEVLRLTADEAAHGALAHVDQIASDAEELPFITELRPQGATRQNMPASVSPTQPDLTQAASPTATHVVVNGVAHPLTEEPLLVGTDPEGDRTLTLQPPAPGISRRHCSIYRVGDRVCIEDHSTYGTFVNDHEVEGARDLLVGDRVRIGTPGQRLEIVRLVER